MNKSPQPDYEYQVGGSLPINAPTYVKRQADSDLYNKLQQGEYCYVLNSRQMGKSSLRVQVMQQLQTEGVACAAIDITAIGTANITPEEWYAGVIDTLVGSFQLYTTFDLNDWWQENGLLSPLQKLSKFIETILLLSITNKIVVFIDEIDSILSVGFNLDDFFALIRECYNRRASNPGYKRLTFALFGVSTPSDLVKDKTRTPFNIGYAIDLKGFEITEAEPLSEGLGSLGDRHKLIAEVLHWTGGQPFLTQKVCKLLVNSCQETGSIGETEVESLIRERIIQNWEAQDEPEHLRTIRDRIFHSGDKRRGRLLGLYQQILQKGEIAADNSPEQAELRLTGLVVQREGKLRIYNRIYQEVFNLQWCEAQLAKLRPYAEALNIWLASQRQDESRLLRGQALQEARIWSADKSLSDIDYQFLSASQDLEKRELQTQMAVETANKEKVAAQNRFTILAIASALITSIAIFAIFQWRAADSGQILALATSSKAKFITNKKTFDSLIDALNAARQLQKSILNSNNSELQAPVMEALTNAVYSAREINRLETHQDLIMRVKFSPDDQKIATASLDNTAKIWSLDGKEIQTLKGHTRPVVDVSFSPDGQIIATASRDKSVKLWNLQGQQLLNLQHQDIVWSVSFSPDGQTIATASADQTVKLWTRNGRLFKTLNGKSGAIYSVSFSPNGQQIATGSYEKQVKLWDTATGQLIHTFLGHNRHILSVTFSPDGQTLASASGDKTVILWDVNKKKLLTKLIEHTDTVRYVNFSPNGQIIATASDDDSIKLWHGKDYQLLETLEGHKGGVYSVVFNNQGNILASASVDKTVKLWQMNDLLTTIVSSPEPIHSIDINNKNNIIITASNQDKNIKRWNLQGEEIKPPLIGHTGNVNSISFSPDGNMIVTGGGDKTVRRWNLQGQEIQPPLTANTDEISSVTFSQDSKIIASASWDGTVKLWSREGKLLKNIPGDTLLYIVKLSPDGNTVATGSKTGKLNLWNRDGKLLKSWQAHEASIYNIQFSPNGQIMATSSEDKTIKLWNLNGDLLHQLSGHNAAIWGLDFSPNGQMIASGSDDNAVKIWDKNGILIASLVGHSSSVNSLRFTGDSKMLLTASSDKKVMRWNVENLQIDHLINRGCSWLRNYIRNHPQATQDICDS